MPTEQYLHDGVMKVENRCQDDDDFKRLVNTYLLSQAKAHTQRHILKDK